MVFFTTKQVLILDKNVFKKGSFITFIHMLYNDDGGLDESSYRTNGIIKDVQEDSFTCVDCNGTATRISIDRIYTGDDRKMDFAPIKILGIRDTVAEGER